eukprot:TRINITY_DN2351_c2_g1_i1.p1 TRINITY_DN2351_c2_g1~~TRINITY_DN2351_c2_g1_i1.p1  ORF type:complete len:1473 (+),score=238.62 TRINITY_DN2351_c2_g1_i1:34-4452(+)
MDKGLPPVPDPTNGTGGGGGGGECSVTVAVRIRPLNKTERNKNTPVVLQVMPEAATVVLGPKTNNPHRFTFDYTWNSMDSEDDEYASQETVYNDFGLKVLKAAFQGYNACIFAYGQTGSGKTYCMMGDPDCEVQQGVIPRLCKDVFAKINDGSPPPAGVSSISYKIEASYLEIYQERVRCLLNPKKENLKIREHPTMGPYIEDLTKLVINDYKDIIRLMEDGNKVRTVAETKMNDQSSRSHAIFQIILTQTKVYSKKVSHDNVSKINLVDLAGSERAKSTGATGTRLQEGADINKSLLTLGLVIKGLAENSNNRSRGGSLHHVNFRDSKLTWLLKDNLGGNSKTFMISTLSPAEMYHDETLSTLRYADRAKSIVTKAVVVEDPNMKLIRQLREELAKYKCKLQDYEEKFSGLPPQVPTLAPDQGQLRMVEGMLVTPRGEMGGDPLATPRIPRNQREAKDLHERIEAMTKLLSEADMSWEEKEEKTRQEEESRLETMKSMGIATSRVVADKLPHFVNQIPDGGWLVQYINPDEKIVIGSAENSDMRLEEQGCLPHHATIWSADGNTYIEPSSKEASDQLCIHVYNDDGEVVEAFASPPASPKNVNGTEFDPASKRVILTHGALVEIGENSFRFVDPRVSADVRAKKKEHHRSFLRAARDGSREHCDPVQTLGGRPPVDESEIRRQLRTQITEEITIQQQQKVPILQLNEVQSQSRLLRLGSARVLRSAKSSSAMRSARSTNEPVVQLLKHALVFVGPEGAGKSSVIRCLTSEPSMWGRKDVPSVTKTIGVDHTEVQTTLSGTQVVLLLQDLSGNRTYENVSSFSIPTSKCVVVLTWDMSRRFDRNEILSWIDTALMNSPGSPLVLIGTHRDNCRENDDGIRDLLHTVQSLLQSRQADKSKHGGQLLGIFAVSCKNRQVLSLPQGIGLNSPRSPGRKPSLKKLKFRDLLNFFTQISYDRCMAHPYFPYGNIPSSVLTVAKRINDLRSSGTWCITSSEYKSVLLAADQKYSDVKELKRATGLLHSWGVLHHFEKCPKLRDTIYTDPKWLYDVLNMVASCAHFQTIGAEAVLKQKNIRFGFNIADARQKDPEKMLSKGILTVQLAMTLFKNSLTLIKKSPQEVMLCLVLLMHLDYLYPVLPPVDSCILPTSPLPTPTEVENDSANRKEEVVYLLPSLFTHPFPGILIDVMPCLMSGIKRRFLFRPALPPNVFSRLLTRTAKCVKRLFVGKQDPPAHRDKSGFSLPSNSFWKNGAWIQDSATTRALMWVGPSSEIHICSNIRSFGKTPSRELIDGITRALYTIMDEYKGITTTELTPCPTPDCVAWVNCGSSADTVACPGCDREISYTELMASTASGFKNSQKSEVLQHCGNPEHLGPLLDKLEMDAVEEPDDDEIKEANIFLDDILKGEGCTTRIERTRVLVNKVEELETQGDPEQARKLEWAMQVVNTQEKLIASATALDEVVEMLTTPPPPKTL